MTNYFDKFGHDVEDLRLNWLARDYSASTKLRTLVGQIHHDICLATAEPGFPQEIREAIHLVFLRYLPEPMPTIYQDLEKYNSSEAAEDGEFIAAQRMGGDLHDLFHEVGRLGREALPGTPLARFTDKPLDPMRQRVSDEEEFRIVLAKKTPAMAEMVAKFDANQARIEAELAAP